MIQSAGEINLAGCPGARRNKTPFFFLFYDHFIMHATARSIGVLLCFHVTAMK
jgi:hypothetical protein